MITSLNEYKNMTISAVEEFNQMDYEQALKKFQEMAAVNPENAKVRELLVTLYLKVGDLENAEKELEEYKRLLGGTNAKMPEMPARSFEDLVEAAGDLEEVEAAYEACMDKEDNVDPVDDMNAATNLGILYMSRGDYKRAEEVLTAFRDRVQEAVSY